MTIPSDHFLYSTSRFPLEAQAYREFTEKVRSSLQLPDDLFLPPGTRFGYKRLELLSTDIADFEWVDINTMIISQRLLDLLTAEKFTGWHAEPIEFPGEAPPPSSGPFWELVIHGRGGKAITSPETRLLSRCPICSREEYDRGALNQNSLNPDEWDGSDFFIFDPPENGLEFTTERVKTFLNSLNIEEANFEKPGAKRIFYPKPMLIE